MEIVFMDDWNYRMVKDNDKYIFYALSGSSAMFEKEYYLSNEDIEEFLKEMKKWCDKKAIELRNS